MAKVMIDPGHGGKDPGAMAVNKRPEKETNLLVALRVAEILQRAGHEVKMSRTSDIAVTLSERTSMANQWQADILVSLHADAAASPSPKGHHAIHALRWVDKPDQGGHKLARLLLDNISDTTGRQFFNRSGSDRGVWARAGSTGKDYYHMIRESAMVAVIIERGFLTNPEDAALLFDAKFLDKQAQGIARGILKYFGQDLLEAGTPIISATSATLEQAQAWARNRGATETFISLATLYWRLAPAHGGVNPAGAYAQSAKETGFGKFGGVIDESYYNPCGLKTSTGGANSNPAAHQRFSSWEEGITAHLDHLALYAGAPGYPKADTPDPRHFLWIRGQAKTFEALGGKWAPSKEYGLSLEVSYLADLLATKAPIVTPPLVTPPKDEKALLEEIKTLRTRINVLEGAMQAIGDYVHQQVSQIKEV